MCSLQFFVVTGCLVTRYDAQVNLMPEVFDEPHPEVQEWVFKFYSLIWYMCVLDSPQNCRWILGIILDVLTGNRVLSSYETICTRDTICSSVAARLALPGDTLPRSSSVFPRSG